jgi:hypothetical protein
MLTELFLKLYDYQDCLTSDHKAVSMNLKVTDDLGRIRKTCLQGGHYRDFM